MCRASPETRNRVSRRDPSLEWKPRESMMGHLEAPAAPERGAGAKEAATFPRSSRASPVAVRESSSGEAR